MHHLAQALLAKEQVLSKLDSYYETKWVKVKTRNRFGPIVLDPDVDWVQEWYFKADDYNRDIGEPNRIIAEELAAFQQAESVTKQVAEENKTLQASNAEAREIRSINAEIEQKVEEEHDNLHQVIKYLNPEQKAHMIAEIISEAGSDFIVASTKDFDLAALAYFAVQKEDAKLIDFVVEQDATIFDSIIIEGQTLLKMAIDKNHPMLSKIITASGNCVNTLITAVTSNDFGTIKTIGAHNPALLARQIFDDMSLLQMAASCNLVEMSQTLISLNPALLKLSNANGDSFTKVTLRSANDSTVKTLSQHLDIESDKMSLDASLIHKAQRLGLIEVEEAASSSEHTEVDSNLMGQSSTKDDLLEVA